MRRRLIGVGAASQVDLFDNMARYLENMDLSKYWTYPGSLTTPTCNEAVTWIVFQDTIRMSEAYVS